MSQTLIQKPTRQSAYRKAKYSIKKRIESQWPPGTRLPPLRDLAAQLGTGHRSLLRAISELREEGWVESVPRRGTTVCDPSERKPVASSSAVVGKTASILVTEPVMDGFAMRIAKPLQETLLQADVNATIEFVPQNHDRDVADHAERGGDAVCVINPSSRVWQKFAPTQVMLAISTAPEVRVRAAGGFDVVSVDHVQGAAIAGWRLREIGCQRVAYLGLGESADGRATFDAISTARLRGLEQGLGHTVPESLRLACRYYDYDSAAATLPAYLQLKDRPDGIFAASDELAIGFIAGATAHGLTAGKDYHIIGFDGQPAGDRIASGPLSTIDVHPQQLGVSGARLLIERLAQPDRPTHRILLGGSLRVGRTALPALTE